MDEVKLKIGADTSGLDKVEKAAKQAFDPRLINETVKAQKEMARSLAESAKSIAEIAKGNKAYNELAKELKTVRSEAEKLKKELAEINRLNGGGPGGRGPGGGGPGGRGPGSPFFAGFAQGSGIANYIPADRPGGLRMAAGSMVGQMVRGAASAAASAASAAASLFLNPGMGGMVSMLNSIPGVGGFLGGGLQAAAGMFQENVAWQRSRLSNIPYAGVGVTQFVEAAQRAAHIRAAGRARADAMEVNVPTTVVPESAFKRTEYGSNVYGHKAIVERDKDASLALERYRELRKSDEEMLAKHGFAPTEQNAFGRQTELGQGVTAEWQTERDRVFAKARGRIAAEEKMMAEQGFMPTGEYNIRETNVVRDPSGRYIVEANKEAREKLAANKKKAIDEANRKAAAVMNEDLGLPGAGAGVRLGYGAAETQQHFGAFMGAFGGRAVRGIGSRFGEAQDLLRAFGVDMGVSGGLTRAVAGGGGAIGSENMGAVRVLATGVAQGLQGSRLVEYMQRMVGLTAKAEQEGMKISLRGVTGSAMAIAAAGGSGGDALRSTADAARFAEKQRGVGLTGVTDPLDLIMLRGAGYNGTRQSYFAAKKKLRAGGLGAEGTTQVLGEIAQGLQSLPPEVAQDRLMSISRSYGINLTEEQAANMLGGAFMGGKASEQTKGIMQGLRGRENELNPQNIRRYAESISSRVGGNVKVEAAMEAERIGEGGKWGGVVQSAQKAVIAQVHLMGNFSGALKKLENTVLEVVKALTPIAEVVGRALDGKS